MIEPSLKKRPGESSACIVASKVVLRGIPSSDPPADTDSQNNLPKITPLFINDGTSSLVQGVYFGKITMSTLRFSRLFSGVSLGTRG